MTRNTKIVVIVGGVVGVGIVLILVAFLIAFQMLVVLDPPSNARCPFCGREFSIPEEHRGTIAEQTREYRCPNCGQRSPPMLLYKQKPAR